MLFSGGYTSPTRNGSIGGDAVSVELNETGCRPLPSDFRPHVAPQNGHATRFKEDTLTSIKLLLLSTLHPEWTTVS